MANDDMFYVGIGASAGGLQAFQLMLPKLEAENACYVICQHLSPHHTSMLSEILARSCKLPIRDIQEDEQLKPGTIYVTPPNKNIELDGDRIRLLTPSNETIPKPSINQFLSSLGQHHGEKSIGVILSGSGSDGAVGLSALHASGGMTMVQSPKSAEYDGMPRAALEASQVDYIGSPKELAQYINNMATHGNQLPIVEDDGDVINAILAYLTAVTGVDFDNYRFSTLARRIARRMSMLQITNALDYLKLIKSNKEEVNAFLQNAFIHVSSLFRDPESFELLSTHLEGMLRQDKSLRDLRIWIPGCAMGEEAVTIAVLLENLKSTKGIDFHYKIFATDISVAAINQARQCMFSLDLCNNLPKEFRREYFFENGNALEVKPAIRDRIVFSVHNLLTDPPFSRMHLISCRNLLIYFKALLQEDVANLFNYSLLNNGLLMLGSSESLRTNGNFDIISEPLKLYRKVRDSETSPIYLRFKGSKTKQYKESAKLVEQFNLETETFKSLLNLYAPAAGVIDENNDLVFTFGDLELFMQKQQGTVSNNVFERVLPELRAELRALVFKTRRTLKSSASGTKEIRIADSAASVSVLVSMFHVERPNWVIISFRKERLNDQDNDTAAKSDTSMLELEQELSVTRENLQTVVEELETANEQLQVYNEELQSSNEEYQSTNEELQTINEELQSTNEELLTVNEELNQKNREQERLSTDLFNIQESLDLPLFLLDNEFRVQRYTKRCAVLADTTTLRIGDIFHSISWLHDMPDLKGVLTTASEEESVVDQEIAVSGSVFRIRISPYLNHQSIKDGIVVSFYDVTSLKQAQNALSIEKDIAETTLNALSEGVIRLNDECKIDYMNTAAEQFLQWRSAEAIGNDVSLYIRLFEDKTPLDLKEIIKDCITANKIFAPKDQFYTAKARFGSDRLVELTVTPTKSASQIAQVGVAITFKDVTERQSHLDHLLWSSKHDSLTGLVNRKEVEIRISNAINESKKSGHESSLLYLDLDQFKVVNDTCGHLAGDQLLKQISELIQQNIRSRDTLARLGGDEFAVLLEKCPIIKAEGVAKLILENVSGYSFYWDDKAFKVGVSIGMVCINKHTESLSMALSDADAACYLAKEQGRNQIQIHDEHNDILEQQRSQMKVVSDINDALENGRLRTYFQEIKSTQNDAESSRWEALIRMFNQEGQFLLPDKFLPAAERFGLVHRIDKWVFTNVVETLCNYFDKEDMPVINVNVSGHTIGDETYLSLVENMLVEKKVPFDRICFELTETAAMANAIRARHFIKHVKNLGCKIAIDDFGTGMSSLAYLTELPVTSVKIDGIFTSSIGKDCVNHVIVESVTKVAHKLNMQVVAESVETDEQWQALQELGVDFVQGYGIRRPIPSEEFVSVARSNNVVALPLSENEK